MLKFQWLGTAQTLTSLAQSKARVWSPRSGGWEWCCQKFLHPEMGQEQENQDPNDRNSQGHSGSHHTASNLVTSSEMPESSPKWAGIYLFGPYPWRCCCTGGMLDLVPLHLLHLKWWGLPDLGSLLSGGIKQKSPSTLLRSGGKSPTATGDSCGAPATPVPPLLPWESPLWSHRIS